MLVLQAGRWWAEQKDVDEDDEDDEDEDGQPAAESGKNDVGNAKAS